MLRLFSKVTRQLSPFRFSELAQAQNVKDAEILKILHSESRDIFRNVAIIAHVDHGKTVNPLYSSYPRLWWILYSEPVAAQMNTIQWIAISWKRRRASPFCPR